MNASLRLVPDEKPAVDDAAVVEALSEWANGLVVVARAAGVSIDGLSGADVAARVVATITSQRTDRALLDTLLHWGLR